LYYRNRSIYRNDSRWKGRVFLKLNFTSDLAIFNKISSLIKKKLQQKRKKNPINHNIDRLISSKKILFLSMSLSMVYLVISTMFFN